jgi:hypothetical protein
MNICHACLFPQLTDKHMHHGLPGRGHVCLSVNQRKHKFVILLFISSLSPTRGAVHTWLRLKKNRRAAAHRDAPSQPPPPEAIMPRTPSPPPEVAVHRTLTPQASMAEASTLTPPVHPSLQRLDSRLPPMPHPCFEHTGMESNTIQ